MTDSVNDEAVYRTAPATPGLLTSTSSQDECFIKVISFCLTHHIFKDEMDLIETECARSVQSSLIFQINHAENAPWGDFHC